MNKIEKILADFQKAGPVTNSVKREGVFYDADVVRGTFSHVGMTSELHRMLLTTDYMEAFAFVVLVIMEFLLAWVFPDIKMLCGTLVFIFLVKLYATFGKIRVLRSECKTLQSLCNTLAEIDLKSKPNADEIISTMWLHDACLLVLNGYFSDVRY